MRVFLTGGSGNVGRRILPQLIRDFEVTVYDLAPPPRDAGVRFLRGDILDSASLHWAMADQDAVVHLAAIPVPGGCSDDTVMQVNVLGTQRVAEAAAMGSPTRLVTASSDSVYGLVFGGGRARPQYVPLDEAHPVCPADSYGLSKLLGEEVCRRYTRSHGLATVCLRYCWVFWDETYAALPGFRGDPGRFRPQMWGYIDVRDVGRAIAAALKAPAIEHETLLLSARRNFLGRPTLDLVREHRGPDVECRQADLYEALPAASAFDWSRAERVLGWEPVHDWAEEAPA